MHKAFAIFVNGKKLAYDTVAYGMNRLTGRQKASLKEKLSDIKIGPFEGAVDNLRVSDIVRYEKDFLPSKNNPETDQNTRVLFLFDETLRGTSFFSKEPVEAE